MNRRCFLTSTGVVGLGSLSGCLSTYLGGAETVDFELWNKTAAAHTVAVLIQNADSESVLSETYEIRKASAGSTPGGAVIREPGFADAHPDERFDVRVVLDGNLEYEHQFRASCVTSETPVVFMIEIEPRQDSALEFTQSQCS